MLDVLLFTTRYRTVGVDRVEQARAAGQPLMFVFWHGRLLPLVYLHRDEGVVVLVSEHDDGEYITRIIRRYGFATTRGSSTRGGVRGLKGLIRAGRAGSDLAITPDGPKGPAREFKPGALLAARASGLPVVPVAVGVSRSWRLKSWDGFVIPKPFSRIHVHYGAPVSVGAQATDEDLRGLAAQLQAELAALTERAEAAARGEESEGEDG
ncbi:MAG: lysophospholipid acyltransferase family protein [Gemmatimonadota bacterium]